jgi:hypothetical protein
MPQIARSKTELRKSEGAADLMVFRKVPAAVKVRNTAGKDVELAIP